MHGLVNRALQSFIDRTYGPDLWAEVATAAGVPPDGFETMLAYDDSVTRAVIDAASLRLGKPSEVLLEDLGAYLVSVEPLRRLLRFAGGSYADFLQSLDELPGRARLAVPDLILPPLTLRAGPDGRLLLCVGVLPGREAAGERRERAGFAAAVLSGLLRAMADDYGALVLIEPAPARAGRAALVIDLLEARFAPGRRFDLAQPRAGAVR